MGQVGWFGWVSEVYLLYPTYLPYLPYVTYLTYGFEHFQLAFTSPSPHPPALLSTTMLRP